MESAIKDHGRTRLVRAIDDAYSRLTVDPDEARNLEAERSAWDATSADGLASEPQCCIPESAEAGDRGKHRAP